MLHTQTIQHAYQQRYGSTDKSEGARVPAVTEVRAESSCNGWRALASQDRGRINMREDYEVEYWTKTFGI